MLRLNLTIPGLGGGSDAPPPSVPQAPKTPLTPDTTRLSALQRKTGRQRGVASTRRAPAPGSTTGTTSSEGSTRLSGLARALRALTGG